MYPVFLDKNSALRAIMPDLYIGDSSSPMRLDERIGPKFGAISLYTSDNLCMGRGMVFQNLPFSLTLPFYDGEFIPEFVLETAYNFVFFPQKFGLPPTPLLIHCQAGASRSASVGYALLRLKLGLSHEDAKKRVQISDNLPRPATLQSTRNWVHKKSCL